MSQVDTKSGQAHFLRSAHASPKQVSSDQKYNETVPFPKISFSVVVLPGADTLVEEEGVQTFCPHLFCRQHPSDIVPPEKVQHTTAWTMCTCYSGPTNSRDGTWRDSWTHLRSPLWRHPSGGRLLHLQVGRRPFFHFLISCFLIARTGHERDQRQ